MVDRITPATTQREIQHLHDNFGIDDAWPVLLRGIQAMGSGGPLTLGRPALEKVGVTFVEDVAPFELMKIRILNGGHAAIAYPPHHGHTLCARGKWQTRRSGAFLAKLEKVEIIPVIPPVPNTVLSDYFDLIERRFSNPNIGDTSPAFARMGSNRQPKFICHRLRIACRGVMMSSDWVWFPRSGAVTSPARRIAAGRSPSMTRMRSACKKAAIAARGKPRCIPCGARYFRDGIGQRTVSETLCSGRHPFVETRNQATLKVLSGQQACD